MRILSLDPSLTCTGYAIGDLRNGSGIDVTEVGKIKSAVRARDVERRVDSITDQLSKLIARRIIPSDLPPVVVIELPSSRKMERHKGGGAGLANYGMLVGHVRQICMSLVGNVVSVKSDYWTGGRSKEKRYKNACRYYKSLPKIKDPGYDVSDAVSLLVWWCQIGRKGTDKTRKGTGK